MYFLNQWIQLLSGRGTNFLLLQRGLHTPQKGMGPQVYTDEVSHWIQGIVEGKG